jgi:hypothetical protein
MCPACLASAALMIAGVVSAGGLTAAAARLLPASDKSKKGLSEESKAKEK